jgi:hypothetical protein
VKVGVEAVAKDIMETELVAIAEKMVNMNRK